MFVVAGLLAWERRPEVPYGALLVLSGALWFVGSYAPAGLMPYSWLGFAFERYYDIVLAAIALTFPGIAMSTGARFAFWALITGFVLRSASRLFVGCDCVENPIALIHDSSLFEDLQVGPSILIAIGALVIALLVLRRLRDSASAARQVLWPVAVGGIVASLVAAWDAIDLVLFVETGAGLIRLRAPWDEVASWTIIAAVALVPIGYLVGVLRLRRRRGPLASLAVQLDRHPGPDDLQAALRFALGDRTAELLVKDDDRSVWINATGAEVDVPDEGGQQMLTLLERAGDAFAAILHDRALQEDPTMLAATAALLRMALENQRLAAEVKAQLVQVRASRARLVAAAEGERRRIERDLHDGAQQRLIAVALALQEARTQAAASAPDASLVRRLDETADELMAAVEELRELARGIHPAVLSDEGLVVALKGLARRASLPVDVNVEIGERLPAEVETAAYYVVAEALTNVTRHARAGRASVEVWRHNGLLEVVVRDNGVGGADAGRGSGLRGLSDRLEAISGSLVVASPPLGGTEVKAVIPCG
jgi:signal transduction histidine kinase